MSDLATPAAPGRSAIKTADELRYAMNVRETFVRSQFQIATKNPRAKGREITAVEVADAFGIAFLNRVIESDAVAICSSRNAAGNQIKFRREQLNLSLSAVAEALKMSVAQVEKIECGVEQTPIRILEKICRRLILDERTLGSRNPGAVKPPNLRLRYFSQDKGDEHNFSDSLVSEIAESFWIMSKCQELSALDALSRGTPLASNASSIGASLLNDPMALDYTYPAWQKGALLARKARRVLGLAAEDPIDNPAKLVEEQIRTFIVPVDWPEEYAGATLSEGDTRSVAINVKGMNRNRSTLRFTICHELGHLLCDTDTHLDRLCVSDVDRISTKREKVGRDLPELRANAFAAEFLMPTASVQRFARKVDNAPNELLDIVQMHYGVSLSAARFKLKGMGIHAEGVKASAQKPKAEDAPELNDIVKSDTSSHISRRGSISHLARICVEKHLIHPETRNSILNED